MSAVEAGGCAPPVQVGDPAPVQALARADLRLIYECHSANSTYGAPYLPSPSKQKRANELVRRGLLQAHDVRLVPNPEGWVAVTVTDAGVAAYNAALAGEGGAS